MTGRRFGVVLACVALCVSSLRAEENSNTVPVAAPKISDLFDPAQNGVMLLSDYYSDGLKHFTTVDCNTDASELDLLAQYRLDVAVMKRAYELPPREGKILLDSHMAWLRYYHGESLWSSGATGSGRVQTEAGTSIARINARLAAVMLPFQDYLVYAKIAHKCLVPMRVRNVRLRFGEIRCPEPAPWIDDPEKVARFGREIVEYRYFILPETCRAISSAPLDGYCAVFRAEDHAYYLCLWDGDGFPFAVYVVDDGKGYCRFEEDRVTYHPVKINTLCVENDSVKIGIEVDGGKSVRIFPLRRNNGKLPL